MNLSRAAKKFRQLELNPISETNKKPKKKVAETPKPVEPVAVIEPPEPVVVEPVAPLVVEAALTPPQPKRPRFVRPHAEKRQRVVLSPLVSSNKPAARVLTTNLFLLPKEPGKVR